MYLPYLRARQFELLALRELLENEKLCFVIRPILEPIKKNSNNLNLALKSFIKAKQYVYLIVNPIVGELTGDTVHYLEYLQELDSDLIIPVFHFRNNANYILNCVRDFHIKKCMVVISGEIDSSDPELITLISDSNIGEFTVFDIGRSRDLKSIIKSNNKLLYRLDNLFDKKNANKEYLSIPAHKFTEEHKYFSEDGFNGFSDFTILPSEFTEGGAPPYAIVIHISYLHSDNTVWIRHFTSNTNDSTSNIQGKFNEALSKAISFFNSNNLTNLAIEELQDYKRREHYPGLGIIKKVSIKNHLLVMGDYLNRYFLL